MKNVIIGTAGHIDHGKTTLIKGLTGSDTDRLIEEKKRGITIELGFAHFDLPSGRRAGLIDVPGHERFIKNMLAGVGGIDIVLLVIAADEGFMPQTQEHLDILSILEVKKGIIVLTKTDMVDEEWVDLVKEEIQQKTVGTFLEEAPIVPVSAVKGQGLKELTQLIDQMTEETEQRNSKTPFRIPIDRVFTIVGFGTVITGTQIEGTVREGDSLTIYPQGIQTKVRSLQVHGKKVDASYAGQRVAINLAGVKKEEISRGNVLAELNSMKPTMMLDIKISLLKSAERVLENRTRLRLYHGANEILCRIVLLDCEELKAGESAYAQLRLEEEIVAKRGDHFVVRFYSPMETIGGGVILEPNPMKHKRFKEDTLEDLKIKEEGSSEDVLEKLVKRFSDRFENIHFFATQTGLGEEMVRTLVDSLITENVLVKFLGNVIVHKMYLEELEEKMIYILNQYHQKHPLKFGIGKEELKSKMVSQVKSKLFDEIIDYFVNKKTIKQKNTHISLHEFEVEYNQEQRKIKEEIEKTYLESGFATPSPEETIKRGKDQKEYRQVLQGMIGMNCLIKINEEFLLHVENYNKGIESVKEFIQKNGSITLAEFRDLLGTTRKYALPFLEHMDQKKITKRVGEKRVLQ